MKKVVGYARISNEDQSHFSISGQIEQIEDYSIRNNYHLLEMYVDEGQSAKDFKRKSWQKLESFLKLHHKEIDYLIVYKYDRFSRNINDALNVIHQLEEVYKIKILSIQEPIGLPPESPFYFQLRMQMLLQAHVERLVIKERTKFGMDKAKKEGRFMGKAPFGYINARDNSNMAIIVQVPEQVEMVQEIYNLFFQGLSFKEIHRRMLVNGFPQTSKDAIHSILSNPVYCGLIKQSDGATYVDGIHEAIIDKQTFYRVQELIKRPELPKRLYNDTAYLKRAVFCHICNRPFTCGKSKGRRKYYWYYECSTHRKSFNLELANERFESIMEILNFSEDHLQYMKKAIQSMLEIHIKKEVGNLNSLVQKQRTLTEKKSGLEEKYISGKLDDETFLKWNNQFKDELKKIGEEIKMAQTGNSLYWNKFSREIENLREVKKVFDQAETPQKLVFINKVFGNTLTYDGEIYRTSYINPIFQHKTLELRRKRLLEFEKKEGTLTESPLGVGNPSDTEPYQLIFDWITNVKSA